MSRKLRFGKYRDTVPFGRRGDALKSVRIGDSF